MSQIDETLALVKELHSHSIINSEDYYSEKLLQIIIALSTLNITKDTDDNLSDDEKLLQDEIAKVKRKVPKWMKKTHQYNYQILKAFMELSDNNANRIEVEALEKYVDIGQAFLANYNNLKTISEKNHGKVFEEIDREVELWEPVAEFIENQFNKRIKSCNDMEDSMDMVEIRIGKYAQDEFIGLLENNGLTEDMLYNLQDKEYSKQKLDMNFPILKKVQNSFNISEERKDERGRDRYYAEPIHGYLLCSQWYSRHRDFLDKWLSEII